MKKVGKLIAFIILIIFVYFAYQYYQQNNFNDYIRSETNLYTSKFIRDNKTKYSKTRSYKIQSQQYNDAMFFKTIKVSKNQPYKISCMVKTNNVKPKENTSGIGAQISIEGTTERSSAIVGTEDWQKIELIFNSKDREYINIGFRLGGYLGESTGEAWFDNFELEEGISDKDNNWKFACFIFETTDVNINQKQIKLNVLNSDILDISNTIRIFKSSVSQLSNNKMTADYDLYNIKEPITKLSYDKEYGYYVAPEDIEEQIKQIVSSKNYDHIFVIVKLGDEKHMNDIEINDWIGLGSMDYYGTGFSNIRLPNESQSYIYKYNARINTFPEEVFLHEFLHSLERSAKEYGYDIPELHDYKKYGYKDERLIGQKNWYQDYMNKEINNNGTKIGLPKEIYNLKPAKTSNFQYAYEIKDIFKEPENIIEEISQIYRNLLNKIKIIINRQGETV